MPKQFVERHHYCASYPSAQHRFGYYDREAGLVGVAVLSRPANDAALTNPFPSLEPGISALELGRLVLLDAVPGNAESNFIGAVLSIAGDLGIQGLLAFADPNPRHDKDGNEVKADHLGIVYRATNWDYAQTSTTRTDHLLPDGTIVGARGEQKVRAQEQGHRYVEDRLVRFGATPMRPGDDPRAWLRRALREAGAVNVRTPGKLRYLKRLGPGRDRIPVGVSIVPYPQWTDIRRLPGLAAL